MVTVRRAIPEDVPAISETHRRSLLEAYDHILQDVDKARFTPESMLEWIGARVANGEYIFVGEIDGVPVGSARWGEEDQEHWPHKNILHTLFIDPDYQGRGVGKALIARCASTALERGHQGMVIGAFIDNPKAWKMYESLGAVRFHQCALQFGENSYDEVLMAWDDLPTLIKRLS